MTKIQTVADQWGMLSKLIFGNNKPNHIQYTEMRRAFYAGFFSALHTAREVAGSIEDAEEAVAALNKLDVECLEFAIAEAAGKSS